MKQSKTHLALSPHLLFSVLLYLAVKSLLHIYETYIPLHYHMRIEATARTQLRDCLRYLLIKQMLFLSNVMRQKHRNKQAFIHHI